MTISYVTVTATVENGKLTAVVPENAVQGEVHIPVPVIQKAVNHKGLDVEALFRALDEFREGLSEEAWAQIEHDINYEYIEPLDEPAQIVAE